MFPKQNQVFRVVIIGGGFSGLGIAAALKRRGIDDFVVLEKSERLGGTWRDNTYPGCACDVPSQLYSYSFAPRADWSLFFAEQTEIQEYTLDVATRFGLVQHVALDTEALETRFDEEREVWVIQTNHGVIESQFVVGGQGPLHEPRIPDLPGLDAFSGTVFHSARWNHEHDLSGRRVAVVGTGSSAIQFIPKIQPQLEHLVVFQRTPGWVLPKPDHEISRAEIAAYRHVPGFQKLVREAIYGVTELLQRAQASHETMKTVQKLAEWQLRRQVADPKLRAALTPDFTLGCKRMLLSNTYYPALTAPNTMLVPHAVARVTSDSVVGADGSEHQVDTLIFGTGFHVTDASPPARVFGRGGRRMSDVWRGSPEAYLGTTVAGFPNLFLMLGPNLGNGHGSAFIIIEAQAKYIVDAIEQTEARGARSFEVKAGVQQAYNDQVQEALQTTVWNAGGCKSWYIDGNGRNSTIYPWTTLDLRKRLARFDPRAFAFTPAVADADNFREPTRFEARHAVVAITGAAHGIGLAAAKRFIAAGAQVALGDIDAEACRRAAQALGPRARAYRLDVAQRSSFEAFVESTERDLGPVDVLVNNAGIMPTGAFLDEADEVDAAVMGVNHWGVSLGMRVVLPGMVQRGRGHVINVASLAGKLGVPFMASYVASKHATVGLSAAVRQELEGSGVSLTTIMPTAVRTRLAAGVPLDGLFAQDADDVARAIVDSLMTREPEVTVPKWAKPVVPLYGLVPRRLLGPISRAIGATRLNQHGVRAQRAEYERTSVAQGQVPRADAAE